MACENTWSKIYRALDREENEKKWNGTIVGIFLWKYLAKMEYLFSQKIKIETGSLLYKRKPSILSQPNSKRICSK